VYNETHATLSPDGKYLYFTSDRKGGFGGLDIYRSEKMDSVWGVPVNLGPLVNSPFNEETPFISTDSKKLFFSSQGHYNMGGYDIFFCERDQNGEWLPPVNLGYPINTADDDLFFYPLGTGSTGYQARYTAGDQCDIIRFSNIVPGNPARFTILGKVELDPDAGFDASRVSVEFKDQITKKSMGIQHIGKDGTYTQKLPGGKFQAAFSNGGSVIIYRDLEIPVYLPQNMLVFNTSLELKSTVSADSLTIADIRFEYNASSLSLESRHYLDMLSEMMVKYPELSMSINGYTDSKGSEGFNLGLSTRRANTVGDHLKTNAAISSRITVNGYGESHPVAMNTHPDGKDYPEGRKYNRRVEIIFENVPSSLVVIKRLDVPDEVRKK
jgi:outer membrane protein OmpA-like peptidoglycan-associated protein